MTTMTTRARGHEVEVAGLPARTLEMLDGRSGRDFAQLSFRPDAAGGVRVEPPHGFVVVRHGKGLPLLLGLLDLTEDGWRYAPYHTARVRSRRGHAGPAAACKGRGPGPGDLVLTRREAVACRLLGAHILGGDEGRGDGDGR